MPITYTVMGTGGLSQPIPGFSPTRFWWIDSSGSNSANMLTTWTFDPTVADQYHPAFSTNNRITGSLLISSDIRINQGQTLTVRNMVLSPSVLCYWEIDFVLLLKNSVIAAVLSNLRPDNVNKFGDLNPIADLTPPTPGVTTDVTRVPWNAGITLNSTKYGPPPRPAYMDSYLQVKSSCRPRGGIYKLVFGSYRASPGVSANVVRSVTVV